MGELFSCSGRYNMESMIISSKDLFDLNVVIWNHDSSFLFPFRTKDASYNQDDGSLRMYIRGRPVQLFAPSPLIDHYSLSKVSPAPQQKLKLEWVYGYRGRDARSNLYLLPTGEIVYFVAAVVVLFNAEEHSQRHYLGHTEDIKW